MRTWSRSEEEARSRRTPVVASSRRSRFSASEHSDLLSGLAEDDAALIEQSSTSQRIAKRRTLFPEGARVVFLYVVRSGSFKLVRHSEEGKELIVALVGKGGLLGALGRASESTALARALEDSVVTAVPTSAVESAMERCPDLSRRVLSCLEERLRSAEIQSARLAFDSVAHRLAGVLVEITDREEGRLTFPLNQTEIANLIGSSRETVCSLLNQFRRDGLVEIPRGRLHVVDREGLETVR